MLLAASMALYVILRKTAERLHCHNASYTSSIRSTALEPRQMALLARGMLRGKFDWHVYRAKAETDPPAKS